MARKRNQGNGRLEDSLKAMLQALANMAQNQTAQSQNQTAILARIAETDAELAGLRREAEETKRLNAQTFARIEQRFARIETILAELPEAVHRDLYAQPQNNGVTGFVAATILRGEDRFDDALARIETFPRELRQSGAWRSLERLKQQIEQAKKSAPKK